MINPGSSSLRLRVVGEGDEVLATEDGPAPGDGVGAALDRFLAGGPPVGAAAVRVVHGGTAFTEATLVDDAVLDRLAGLDELAPLHNPPARHLLAALRSVRPDLPAVACFDTAFHRTLAPAATRYAVPWRWTNDLGIRRYGFHGLSHAWVARRSAELSGHAGARTVSCHLGSGASLCAIAGGRSVDTTMGFTPDEGLVMATRSGSVDPGAVLWAQEREDLTAAQTLDLLEQESGLVGLAGSADLRQVLAAAAGGDGRAQVAVEVYVHRLRAGIGAMAAALDGLDVLVFTGGVGEHAAAIRAKAAEGLSHLGVALDPVAAEGTGDRELTAAGAAARTFVIAAREDLVMAAEARAVLA